MVLKPWRGGGSLRIEYPGGDVGNRGCFEVKAHVANAFVLVTVVLILGGWVEIRLWKK